MKTKPQPRTSKWLPGNPEWEAMKAATRNLPHHEAVAESAALREQYFRMCKARAFGMVELYAVLRILREKRVPFVLTGAHGIAAWTGRPRATHDVDILVKSGRNYVRAVKALRSAYPELEVHQAAGVTGFFLPGDDQSLLDVTYPHRVDLAETLETAIWVEEKGERYRIPRLEAALANKYGASLALSRDPGKRAQDLVDFYFMVKHAADPGRQPIDLEKVRELGEKVWPGGGGAEILRMVQDAQEGKVPNLNPPGRL
jgi:hypothetical protein